MQWLLHRIVAVALLPSTGGSPRSETKKKPAPKGTDRKITIEVRVTQPRSLASLFRSVRGRQSRRGLLAPRAACDPFRFQQPLSRA